MRSGVWGELAKPVRESVRRMPITEQAQQQYADHNKRVECLCRGCIIFRARAIDQALGQYRSPENLIRWYGGRP